MPAGSTVSLTGYVEGDDRDGGPICSVVERCFLSNSFLVEILLCFRRRFICLRGQRRTEDKKSSVLVFGKAYIFYSYFFILDTCRKFET